MQSCGLHVIAAHEPAATMLVEAHAAAATKHQTAPLSAPPRPSRSPSCRPSMGPNLSRRQGEMQIRGRVPAGQQKTLRAVWTTGATQTTQAQQLGGAYPQPPSTVPPGLPGAQQLRGQAPAAQGSHATHAARQLLTVRRQSGARVSRSVAAAAAIGAAPTAVGKWADHHARLSCAQLLRCSALDLCAPRAAPQECAGYSCQEGYTQHRADDRPHPGGSAAIAAAAAAATAAAAAGAPFRAAAAAAAGLVQ